MKEKLSKRIRVFNKTGGKCAYCGCDLDFSHFELDHIIPQYIGGNDFEYNFFPACAACNAAKSYYTIEEFRKRIAEVYYNKPPCVILRKYYDVTPKPIVFYFEKTGLKIPNVYPNDTV